MFLSDHQLPDSFPHIIERQYGPEAALRYEKYVQQDLKSSDIENTVRDLKLLDNYQVGVNYMNQVISSDRIIRYG